MSNASQRALASMHRERERRLRLTGEGEMGIGQLVTTGEPGWDAFFGALHDKEAAARAAGMGFRADLGGIGRWAEQDPGLVGGVNPLERTSLKYQAMQRQGDADVARAKLEMAGQRAMVNAESDQRLADFRASDDERKLATAFAPPMQSTVATETVGPDGRTTAVTLRPTRAETQRERLRATLPPALVPQFEKQWAAEDTAKAKADLEARKQTAAEEAAAATTLPDDAIEDAALRYNKTGVMPTLGMKDPGNRQRIMARAAELARANGGKGADIATNAGIFKADAASLAAIQKQRDAVGAFEGTALKNLDVFLDLATKIPDTGSPALNRPLRAISEQGLGSAELAAYNTARRTVIPEFAKILSSPGLSGQLSDSARHEIEEVLSGNATLAQTMAVAKTLKTDANNRRTEYDRQIGEIKDRMRGGDKDKSGAPDAASLREKYRY